MTYDCTQILHLLFKTHLILQKMLFFMSIYSLTQDFSHSWILTCTICCCCSKNLEPKVFSRDCGVTATRANTLIIFSAELYCWPLPASPLFAKMWWASVLYYYVLLLVAYQHKYFVDTIEWKTDFWTKQQNKVDFGVTCFLPKWTTILYLYVRLKPAILVRLWIKLANVNSSEAMFTFVWQLTGQRVYF